MKLPGGLGQLTYCTNVHRAETWEEVRRVVSTDVLAIKELACPDAAFGVGLRLSGMALGAVDLIELKNLLDTGGAYVFTLNAFPYGPFHGTPVKAAVYLPDWRSEVRLDYTNRSAELLAFLLPADQSYGSVSTVPGAFKASVTTPGDVERMADLMIRHASHLVDIERRTGRLITLAIEPEPCCLLETTAEAIAYFEAHLFCPAAASRLAALSGLSPSGAAAALRRHLGLCIDLCHAAVEYEMPRELFDTLRGAGIAVPKIQISSALTLSPVDAAAIAKLAPFDDGVYLHQVVERCGDGLRRFADLADAAASDRGDAAEWRIHYHVPLFLEELGVFGSTQAFVREALALHRAAPLTEHLEIETYTWDVLPVVFRANGLVPAIARELKWVGHQLVG